MDLNSETLRLLMLAYIYYLLKPISFKCNSANASSNVQLCEYIAETLLIKILRPVEKL